MRKIAGVRQLSLKETREFLKLAYVRDEELSDRHFEVRVLPDGRVVQCLSGLGYLADSNPASIYPSREVFVEMRREIAERSTKGPVDLTRTLLPPIDDFLRDVEAYAKSLGERLRVPDEALDRTPASLDAVDAALRRIPKAKRMAPEVVTPLVAYVGFVMLAGCEGRWTKAPVGPHVTANENEPVIKARDGRILQPFAPVVLPMVEPSRRLPLRAAVDVYLLPYRGGDGTGTGGAAYPGPG
jgi:hypothetical protein